MYRKRKGKKKHNPPKANKKWPQLWLIISQELKARPKAHISCIR